MRFRLMVVAYRLRKTVSEIASQCTASEIGDWIEFFEIIAPKAPGAKEKEENKGPHPDKVRQVMDRIAALKMRLRTKRDGKARRITD